ncbi:MAG: hypothetical protein KF852_05110 [Saprospiraceae bacterium]|nr:hypothetical protein [Saprospiraceae bacterium]
MIHQYFEVYPVLLWEITENDLPSFKAGIQKIIILL